VGAEVAEVIDCATVTFFTCTYNMKTEAIRTIIIFLKSTFFNKEYHMGNPIIILFFRPLRYLDPGSGSILIQLVIAALGGGLFFLFKNQWKQWFKKGKKDGKSTSSKSKTTKLFTKKQAELPKKCPNCGQMINPQKVNWLDDDTAECDKCGETLERK
jgi:predicted RNA-binding Zn-ribbon protein involved in translation (DUF1610 family)